MIVISDALLKSGLTGNELLVYALVSNVTETGNMFSLSVNDMADRLNLTRSSARSVVQRLLDKGMLSIRNRIVDNVVIQCYETTCITKNDEAVQPIVEATNDNPALDLSFVDPRMSEAVQTWLEYKKRKCQSYKNADTIRVMYNRLRDLSGGDVCTASKIIEQSIANNWSGLFAIHGNNGNSNQERCGQIAAEVYRGLQDSISGRG